LAFHPYPQLIPSVFNLSGFGPPRGLTRASPWPWVDHSASGPEHTTTPPHGGYALFRLAFAAATPHGLTSRHVPDSQAHSSKGTPSPHPKGKALTACRHTVSGTISLPSRGTFHHSLTVLIRYRSSGSIQAYRVVPADSQQIPRARCYSGNDTNRHAVFAYRALTVYGRPSQATSANHTLLLTSRIELERIIPTTPHTQPLPGITCARFSHPPRSLATTNGITLVFFSYGY
jgi:hypothetical protein